MLKQKITTLKTWEDYKRNKTKGAISASLKGNVNITSPSFLYVDIQVYDI